MTKNLTKRTVSAMSWTIFANIFASLMQLIYTASMARLLNPSDHGLVAFCSTVLHFGTYLAQMGLGPALIQKKDLISEEIRATFTANVVLGAFACFFFIIAAPLATYLMEDAQVVLVMRVMALSLFLSALPATSINLLKRDLAFKKLAKANMLTSIIGQICVGIPLAYWGMGVWSLVIASLSQTIINGLINYFQARHSLMPTFQWKYYKSLLSYGSRMSLIQITEFLNSQLDRFFISKLAGSSALGLYSKALLLIELPIYTFSTAISRVLFPALSTIQSDIPRISKIYIFTVSFSFFFIGSVGIGAAIAAEQIVIVVLGENWREAIPIFQILAIAIPIKMSSHFAGVFADALALLNAKNLLQVFSLFLLAALFWFMREFGLVGFAYSLLIYQIIKHIIYIYILHRALSFEWKKLIIIYLYALYAILPAALSIAISVYLTTSWLALPYLIGLLSTGVAGLIGLLFSIKFCLENEFKQMIFEKISIHASKNKKIQSLYIYLFS